MRYQTDIKSGLDPLFGLPVTRDSKAMDAARCKNFRFDKRLETSLKTIDDTMHTKIIKCHNLVTKTREFLTTINPDPDKRVVCPPGLSSEQKKTIRILRRGSLPSMSLNEFDQKLLSTRVHRETVTALDDTFTEKTNKNKLCEFKLKRKVFSYNSKRYPTSRSTPNLDRCVMDSVASTNNPLYRCKTVMGDAYQRLTSADVAKNRNRDMGKLVGLPDNDKDRSRPKRMERSLSERSSSETSVSSKQGRKTGVLRNGRVPSTYSSSSESSTDEERYERFMTVLRGETTKLPDIVIS